MFVTADHGNAEEKWDEYYQQPHTAHTKNPVPFFMITAQELTNPLRSLHTLADVAPCILSWLHLPIPSSMQHTLDNHS